LWISDVLVVIGSAGASNISFLGQGSNSFSKLAQFGTKLSTSQFNTKVAFFARVRFFIPLEPPLACLSFTQYSYHVERKEVSLDLPVEITD
jgi:hypothetical protein